MLESGEITIVMPQYLLDSGKIIDMPFAGRHLSGPGRKTTGRDYHLRLPVHKKPRTYSSTLKAIIHRGISLPRAR
jgi:hypothetical protein